MKSILLLPILALGALLAPVHLQAQVVVNEYSCANLTQFYDHYQSTEDWIELYNTSDFALNIAGYHLSDNEKNPTKWTIPANTIIPPKGFLFVWCSGRDLKDPQGILHTNFRLTQTKNNPEHIVFSSPSGTILEDIVVEKTKIHQSWARFPDGANDWRIALQPTLGTSNDNAPNALRYAARPGMNQTAGFHSGPLSVAISTDEPNAVIRYTLDGREPSPSSPLYSQPINLTKTTVIKAASFSNDPLVLPSFVQFNTYFVNETHTLAVISVAADGLLSLANGNQSLRPHGSIEYFDKNKQRQARTYGELNSHGQDSWVNDQRSLDWISRDEMGYNSAIKEKLIPQLSERDEFQRIILRAAGDDNYPANNRPTNEGSAHIRDAYVQNLSARGGLYLDVRKSEKCIVYLNGNYWGVYDIREKVDDHDYTEFYHGQGKYEIQYVKTWGTTWAEYGGQDAVDDWRTLRDFVINNDMNDPAKFELVDEIYDWKSLIDYVVVNSFTVCTDWLNYNTGIWRGFNHDGKHQKWGYVLWDNDAVFDFYINYTGLPSTHYTALPCNPESLTGGSDPERHIRVLNRLRANPEVNRYYVTRMADLMYTVFGCENMLNYLDTIENLIDPEMARHAQRWNGTYQGWKNNVDELRDFIVNRCNLLPSLMDDCYSVTGPFQTVIKVEPPLAGTLHINTLRYSANQFPHAQPYFGGPDAGISLWAYADTAAGYKFDHWSAINHTFAHPDSVFGFLNLSTPDTITAHFSKQSSSSAEPILVEAADFEAFPTVFNERGVNVNYHLPEKSKISFRLFDLLGKQVGEFNAGETSGKGSLQLDLEAKQLPPGVYFLTAKADYFEKTMRLIRAN